MAQCSYCNTTIFFGGVRDGEKRFCNARCHEQGLLLSAAQLLPEEAVRGRLHAVHQGPCPQCHRVGDAIDVHTSHSIWSVVVLTSWKSVPQICCSSCGKKAKLKATIGSFFLGWWGFPWGLLITPVQIGRNLWGLARTPTSFAPSPQLEKLIRLSLAAELREAQQKAVPPPLVSR
jgi:hypothetical protein